MRNLNEEIQSAGHENETTFPSALQGSKLFDSFKAHFMSQFFWWVNERMFDVCVNLSVSVSEHEKLMNPYFPLKSTTLDYWLKLSAQQTKEMMQNTQQVEE